MIVQYFLVGTKQHRLRGPDRGAAREYPRSARRGRPAHRKVDRSSCIRSGIAWSGRWSRRPRARRIVEIGALRGETTALMLEKLGPDTELHVIDPVPEFDPAEHEKQLPRSLHLPPRREPQRAADAAARRRRARRRRPQLVHRVPRAPDAQRDRAQGRRAAAGDDHARRRLAVRPPRPLLRARTRSRGVPPALRDEGHPAGHQTRAAAGRAQPAALQRGRRGRPAQRRDDRARRFRRRVRPAAARARAPDLLRARDRGGGSAARRRARARAPARLLRDRPRARTCCCRSRSRPGSRRSCSSTTTTTAAAIS